MAKSIGYLGFFPGVITNKLQESQQLYTEFLGFHVIFANDWYIHLQSSGQTKVELGFLVPDHPDQAKVFQPIFLGQGIFFSFEVEDVDAEYTRLKALDIPIAVDLRDEPWGDRHFSIIDPNGIGIDILRYRSPEG